MSCSLPQSKGLERRVSVAPVLDPNHIGVKKLANCIGGEGEVEVMCHVSILPQGSREKSSLFLVARPLRPYAPPRDRWPSELFLVKNKFQKVLDAQKGLFFYCIP